jgi:hypothetical protein
VELIAGSVTTSGLAVNVPTKRTEHKTIVDSQDCQLFPEDACKHSGLGAEALYLRFSFPIPRETSDALKPRGNGTRGARALSACLKGADLDHRLFR